MNSKANEFRQHYDDTNDLMTALDAAGVPKGQNWEDESTTWFFDDGSSITISAQDVQVKSN